MKSKSIEVFAIVAVAAAALGVWAGFEQSRSPWISTHGQAMSPRSAKGGTRARVSPRQAGDPFYPAWQDISLAAPGLSPQAQATLLVRGVEGQLFLQQSITAGQTTRVKIPAETILKVEVTTAGVVPIRTTLEPAPPYSISMESVHLTLHSASVLAGTLHAPRDEHQSPGSLYLRHLGNQQSLVAAGTLREDDILVRPNLDGSFRHEGLLPGTYAVRTFVSGCGLLMSRIELWPGRTTEIKLFAGAGRILKGRVLCSSPETCEPRLLLLPRDIPQSLDVAIAIATLEGTRVNERGEFILRESHSHTPSTLWALVPGARPSKLEIGARSEGLEIPCCGGCSQSPLALAQGEPLDSLPPATADGNGPAQSTAGLLDVRTQGEAQGATSVSSSQQDPDDSSPTSQLQDASAAKSSETGSNTKRRRRNNGTNAEDGDVTASRWARPGSNDQGGSNNEENPPPPPGNSSTGELELRYYAAEGYPLEGATLQVSRAGNPFSSEPIVATLDRHGRALLPNLLPGQYRVRLHLHSPSHIPMAERHYRVYRDRVTYDRIEVENLSRVRVRLANPSAASHGAVAGILGVDAGAELLRALYLGSSDVPLGPAGEAHFIVAAGVEYVLYHRLLAYSPATGEVVTFGRGEQDHVLPSTPGSIRGQALTGDRQPAGGTVIVLTPRVFVGLPNQEVRCTPGAPEGAPLDPGNKEVGPFSVGTGSSILVSDASGHFSFEGAALGAYTLSAWHPVSGRARASVELDAGSIAGTTELLLQQED